MLVIVIPRSVRWLVTDRRPGHTTDGTKQGTKTVFARIYVITTTDGELTPSHRGGYFLNLNHLEIFTIVVEVFSGKISTPGLAAGPDDYIMFFLVMPPLS